MGVGYQKFQAGSPDGYLDFGVISTPDIVCYDQCNWTYTRDTRSAGGVEK